MALFYLRKLLYISLFFALAQLPVLAGENWGLCSIPGFNFVETKADNASVTEVEANRMSRSANDLMYFSGEVILKQDNQIIQADEVLYNAQTEQFEASGAVVLEKPDIRVTTEKLSLDQIADNGDLINPSFEMSSRHGRGEASRLNILDESRSRFTDILYTTCDVGDRDWYFTGKELEIDQESGIGSAHHATIFFQHMPIFYFPYFQFPIDDRRMSGVLAPSILFSGSENKHLAIPIYWNIAANFDTTFTPAWYPERGLLYSSEHRYLFENNRGQVDYFYLDDDIENDTRWYKKWQHSNAYASAGLTSSLLLQEVSDDNFFSDFDRLSPGRSDINHLDRHYRLSHAGKSWQTSLLWQNYQTVDTKIAIASRPYQQLPQLTVNSLFNRQANGLQFNIQNELVHFKRESSVNGNRAHTTPTLNWNSSNSWYFFEPQLQFAVTEYSLDNNNLGENSIRRSLPITTLDSGLFFERVTGPDNGWLQTLEPRLYFVHIPFEEQGDIPDFDASVNPESYASFFKANRFRGVDRIGDTEQVTFGLGSRIYDNDNGNQLLYASIAQVFYGVDRKVSLNGVTEEGDRSNIIARIDISPDRNLRIGTELVYDEELNELGKRELSINWARNGFATNLGYYFDEEELEQSIFSIVYPVNDYWTIIAKYHQSQLYDKPVENLFGVNYESCCWGLKILASQVSDDDFEEIDQSLFFELTLKGLTQAGKDIDARLHRVIPGYQPRF